MGGLHGQNDYYWKHDYIDAQANEDDHHARGNWKAQRKCLEATDSSRLEDSKSFEERLGHFEEL